MLRAQLYSAALVQFGVGLGWHLAILGTTGRLDFCSAVPMPAPTCTGEVLQRHVADLEATLSGLTNRVESLLNQRAAA